MEKQVNYITLNSILCPSKCQQYTDSEYLVIQPELSGLLRYPIGRVHYIEHKIRDTYITYTCLIPRIYIKRTNTAELNLCFRLHVLLKTVFPAQPLILLKNNTTHLHLQIHMYMYNNF